MNNSLDKSQSLDYQVVAHFGAPDEGVVMLPLKFFEHFIWNLMFPCRDLGVIVLFKCLKESYTTKLECLEQNYSSSLFYKKN